MSIGGLVASLSNFLKLSNVAEKASIAVTLSSGAESTINKSEQRQADVNKTVDELDNTYDKLADVNVNSKSSIESITNEIYRASQITGMNITDFGNSVMEIHRVFENSILDVEGAVHLTENLTKVFAMDYLSPHEIIAQIDSLNSGFEYDGFIDAEEYKNIVRENSAFDELIRAQMGFANEEMWGRLNAGELDEVALIDIFMNEHIIKDIEDEFGQKRVTNAQLQNHDNNLRLPMASDYSPLYSSGTGQDKSEYFVKNLQIGQHPSMEELTSKNNTIYQNGGGPQVLSRAMLNDNEIYSSKNIGNQPNDELIQEYLDYHKLMVSENATAKIQASMDSVFTIYENLINIDNIPVQDQAGFIMTEKFVNLDGIL